MSRQAFHLVLFGLLFAALGAFWAFNAGGGYVATTGNVVKTVLKDEGTLGTAVRLLFSYQVAGVTYESTRAPELNKAYSSKQDALNKQAEYWDGRSIPVYYDASNPKNGMTELPKWRTGWFVFAVGVAMMLLGVLTRRRM